jgi:hypothetical protein
VPGPHSACYGTGPLAIRRIGWLRDLGVVVFWFTVTNYLCTFLLAMTIGVFLFEPKPVRFAAINAVWLVALGAGIVLWFRYRLRMDERGNRARTLLLLWALPLVPFTLCEFSDAVGFFLYGLVSFVAGVFILAACWWRMAEASMAQGWPVSR